MTSVLWKSAKSIWKAISITYACFYFTIKNLAVIYGTGKISQKYTWHHAENPRYKIFNKKDFEIFLYGVHVHGLELTYFRCSDSDDSRSDGEEEFYYTEIEVNVDNVTQKFSQMCTSSPPEVVNPLSPSIPVPDHDYQKKVWKLNVFKVLKDYMFIDTFRCKSLLDSSYRITTRHPRRPPCPPGGSSIKVLPRCLSPTLLRWRGPCPGRVTRMCRHLQHTR